MHRIAGEFIDHVTDLDHSGGHDGCASNDLDVFGTRVVAVLDVLDRLTTTIASGYTYVASEPRPTQRLADPRALTTGIQYHSSAGPGLSDGFAIAPRYTVMAVHVATEASPPQEPTPTSTPDRVVRLMRREIAARFGHLEMTALSPIGGTIVLPEHPFTDQDLDHLVTAISHAINAETTVCRTSADKHELPEATERAHRLLDLLIANSYPPQLYRYEDMPLETQIARPGPGRDALAAILDPLDTHPELLELLRIHLRNNFDRQRTAEHFGIHCNTVDHRLHRIERLTGWNPASSEGGWRLGSALTARTWSLGLSPRH
ncbi:MULTISPECIES: PucR family transcriptional regulator [Nocardia]|uniref:PucR family transcriptional regulator n=1 Tax=Nocardia TaxID=1817 RepID=UPI001300A8F8|nr:MULTISPECIES: helix-turn-helix domain-containing protein [Nocardia]